MEIVIDRILYISYDTHSTGAHQFSVKWSCLKSYTFIFSFKSNHRDSIYKKKYS